MIINDRLLKTTSKITWNLKTNTSWDVRIKIPKDDPTSGQNLDLFRAHLIFKATNSFLFDLRHCVHCTFLSC